MSGSVLAFLALAVVVGAGAFWFQRISAVRTGTARRPVMALMAVAVVLALLAFASGPGLVAGLVAGLALAASGTFLALQPLSGQARTPAAVAVGQPIVDFTAPDDAGEAFDLASLRGRPFLLKFFRGHW